MTYMVEYICLIEIFKEMNQDSYILLFLTNYMILNYFKKFQLIKYIFIRDMKCITNQRYKQILRRIEYEISTQS